MRAGIAFSAFALPLALVAACFSDGSTSDDAGVPDFDETGAGRDGTVLGEVVVAPMDGGRDSSIADAAHLDSTPADAAHETGVDAAHDAPSDAPTLTYPEAVMADTPLSYWRFGESTGTVATDAVGANNGTYTGGFTLGAAGAIAGDTNKAVSFDGTSGYVSMGSVFNFAGTTSMSIELWVKPAAADTSYRRLVSKETVDGNGREGYLLAYEGANNLSFERFQSGAETAIGGAITPDVYSHVVATFDGTTMVLYVNGALLDSSASPQSIATITDSFNVATYSTEMTADCIDATIDEVAVYDHALSAQAVLSHYRIGTGM